MTAVISTLLLTVPASQAAGSGAPGRGAVDATSSARLATLGVSRVSAPEKCSARRAVRFYSAKIREHAAKMGVANPMGGRLSPTTTGRLETPRQPCPRYLARVLQRKARAWRLRAERYLTLRDFDVLPGYSGWRLAVDEVQRAYPGTKAWLLSCSASEGGWGRWVLNSHGAGGWMQFLSGTFWRMWGSARADVLARGFRVPRSAASWRSPLGQALAGAWGYRNGRTHEWFGGGC